MTEVLARQIKVAIDAQLSPKTAGGTETALLSLLLALRDLPGGERFLLLGLKGYDHELPPFMGSNMEKMVWPGNYRWFDPSGDKTGGMGPRWCRLQSALGPLGGIIPFCYRYYAYNTPLTPQAILLAGRLGPLKFLVPPAYRLYRGLRQETARPMVAARADRLLKAQGVSVVHFPYPLHFETGLPFVYEPWGLPHHHQPECFRSGEAAWMDRLFGHGCREAAMVVTATRWVKQDIMDKYGIDADKIAVIPRLPRFDNAERFMPDEEALAGLPAEFALFPSATWVTKNHLRLIRAIAMLRDRHGIRLDLVCTGRTDTPESHKIEEEIQRYGLQEQIRFLGVVPVERLNTLFRRARFLVHPSIFEGLGLPLLEAFHHNLPVVASRAACIPETVGDAALMFDPFDEADICRALREVMERPEQLNMLRERGKSRLAEDYPNPVKVARMFDTVYRRACGAPLSNEQQALLAEMLS
jgi:glycosyltransferase involved in cell wall biosynthesis